MHESQLYRIQISTDKSSSMAQGKNESIYWQFGFSVFMCVMFISSVGAQIFHKRMPPEAVDLVSRLLQYSPNLRSSAVSTLSNLYMFLFTKRLPALGFPIAQLLLHCVCPRTTWWKLFPWLSRLFWKWWGNPIYLYKSTSLPYYVHGLAPLQLDALMHPFFDELRDPNTRLPNGRFLPPLFNFNSHGKVLSRLLHLLLFYCIL